MSVIHEAAFQVQWNEGEEEMHRILRVPHRENPSSPFLTPNGANLLMRCPLLALGTLDSQGRPWTTLIGGEAGFSRPIAQSIIGIKTLVDRAHDPVVETLLGADADGEPVRIEGNGKMVSGLAIDLENRRRVKIYGRMVGGALAATTPGVGEVQVVVKIEQSLGNCPKYLNRKEIIPQIPQPELVSDTLPLSKQATNLLAKSDLFFISSSNSTTDMDTNIRGGPPGFLRVLSNNPEDCTLIYPEYSGNRLYQTLGNLRLTPQAGLIFPDFETGDVLYITGRTEILTGLEANKILPRSNLAVKIHVVAARFVTKGLAFRGEAGEPSPYNPPIRYLTTEKPTITSSEKEIELKLIDRKLLTPTIARFRFGLTDSHQTINWRPGQYAMISLEKELNIGYSHMRDEDPTSLNDDFIRTFTISNRPDNYDNFNTNSNNNSDNNNTDDNSNNNGSKEFEITIRNIGPVTSALFRHNIRSTLEASLTGISGSFFFEHSPTSTSTSNATLNTKLAFIAGGIGITPLISQAPSLDLETIVLFWSVAYDDIGLVIDTFERIPGLAGSSRVFVTGKSKSKSKPMLAQSLSGGNRGGDDIGIGEGEVEGIREMGAGVERRRMEKRDLKVVGGGEVDRWYVCASTKLRMEVMGWLEGEQVLFEDFSY